MDSYMINSLGQDNWDILTDFFKGRDWEESLRQGKLDVVYLDTLQNEDEETAIIFEVTNMQGRRFAYYFNNAYSLLDEVPSDTSTVADWVALWSDYEQLPSLLRPLYSSK